MSQCVVGCKLAGLFVTIGFSYFFGLHEMDKIAFCGTSDQAQFATNDAVSSNAWTTVGKVSDGSAMPIGSMPAAVPVGAAKVI